MIQQTAQRFTETLAQSFKNNWQLPALSNFQGNTYSFQETAYRIARMHLYFKACGLKEGDKVALCARNSAEWAIAFLSTVTYGAVAVPILHEFHTDTIEHLVDHCEARVLFTDSAIASKLNFKNTPKLENAILIPEFSLFFSTSEEFQQAFDTLDTLFASKYPNGFGKENVSFSNLKTGSLMLINYTSGSTGNSKGVMLSVGNIWSNVNFALHKIPFFNPGDAMVSMLPLAHMYGLVFEFLFPLCRGCHIIFLGKIPSPAVVLKAFAQYHPKMVITVPLVIEKIVKTKIIPQLQKQPVKTLLHIPLLNTIVYRSINRKLLEAFGGNLQQLILGGAPLSDDVEALLRRIHFPFTIGYGMTECAPLLTYEWWASQRPKSCGRMVDGMSARIDSPDPTTTPGVLSVRGNNVMMGYFKNPEATAQALDKDGWLNTGDICTMDKDGYLYIRGRNKNMILGPSGQNIYPEEIEVKLNNLPYVAESVVVDRDGRIVALVHPDYEAARHAGLSEQVVEQKIMEQLPVLNRQLPAYSHVKEFEIHKDEFEKTPKHSIRRFLYK